MMNEMIKRVLKVKAENFEDVKNGTGVKAEAIEVVEREGFVILTDDDNSEQGYVTIKNEETDKSLVISKDRRGRTRIFDGFWGLVDSDERFNRIIKDFDAYEYLITK